MNIPTPNFDQNDRKTRSAVLDFLTELMINDPSVPEHQKVSVRIINACKKLDQKLQMAAHLGANPHPDLDESERRYPQKKELLEYLQLMEAGLDSFLAAHPCFAAPPRWLCRAGS